MSVSAEARELAGKTAAEIRRRGWTQGTMADIQLRDKWEEEEAQAKNCRVCLIGGIAAALTGDPRKGDDLVDGYAPHPTALQELADEFASFIDFGYRPNRVHLSDLITWNDRGDRKVDEVLAILDQIATAQ